MSSNVASLVVYHVEVLSGVLVPPAYAPQLFKLTPPSVKSVPINGKSMFHCSPSFLSLSNCKFELPGIVLITFVQVFALKATE